MELPQELREAIDKELAPLSPKEIATISQELSKRYREGLNTKGEKFLRSSKDVTAYAAFRLPATFAAVVSALRQIKGHDEKWSPKSLIDIGAGPGTAMWAALEIWPAIENINLLERDVDMIALGKRLATYSSLASVKQANWVKTDLTGGWENIKQDLVIASYSLGELSEESFRSILHKLWSLTNGILVIIEPGTPVGFSCVREAREILLNEGAKTIAPCPHDKDCPIQDNDWCHFSQRVARSRLHRLVKGGELSYEDEKFSFIALSREVNSAIKGRVLRHPQIRKGHIQLEVCTPEGIESRVITRSNREDFRSAKDLGWGSDIS